MKDHKLDVPVHKDQSTSAYEKLTGNDVITIVSGLPRSGTSMMMKMLDKGNMSLLTDHNREADIDNPKGYYELDKVKELEHDNSWLEMACGKAIKIVSPLLQHLPMNSTHRYKIIFMLRSLDEVLDSQRKMADRISDCEERVKDNILKHNYSMHLEEIRHWMEKEEHIEFMYVNYSDVVSDPLSASEEIQNFLDTALNTAEMAGTIDHSLYRQRMENTQHSRPADISEAATEKEAIMDQLKQLGYL
jgi:hypothetical protein